MPDLDQTDRRQFLQKSILGGLVITSLVGNCFWRERVEAALDRGGGGDKEVDFQSLLESYRRARVADPEGGGTLEQDRMACQKASKTEFCFARTRTSSQPSHLQLEARFGRTLKLRRPYRATSFRHSLLPQFPQESKIRDRSQASVQFDSDCLMFLSRRG